MNNKMEHVARALVVLFLLASIAVIVTQVSDRKVIFAVPGIILLVIRFAISYWLYGRAKSESKYPWVWSLLGLTVGLITVGVYFVMDIHQTVCCAQGEKEQT